MVMILAIDFQVDLTLYYSSHIAGYFLEYFVITITQGWRPPQGFQIFFTFCKILFRQSIFKHYCSVLSVAYASAVLSTEA